mmetsp:Transcript_18404/g.39566  ORF Transcript_18404/g.39566 Transcript_18404/m.39566 type:complete len:302 (-) Transcript_18404:724-1629(-)
MMESPCGIHVVLLLLPAGWSTTRHVYRERLGALVGMVVLPTPPPPDKPVSHCISPPSSMKHSVGVQGKNSGVTIHRVTYSTVNTTGSMQRRHARREPPLMPAALSRASRTRTTLRFSTVKSMARMPASAPMSAAGTTARMWEEKDMPTCSNVTSWSNQPKCPPPRMARPALLDRLSVRVAHMQAKKTCQPKLCCQKLATSSNANSRPPMGALKAAATPTDTPAVTKSRLSLGLRKRLNRPVLNPRVVLCPWLSALPSAAPMWMRGPSGPTGRPLPTARPHDRNLTATVRMLKTLGSMHPLR